METVSVIIVTWNNEKDIFECLSTISNQSYSNYNIIVVDNKSSDKTVEIVKTNFPHVKLIEEQVNHFLTPANNLGIRYAIKEFDSKYVMVLNPDTKVEANLIESLVESINKNPKYGAAGPKVKFYQTKDDGKINSAGLLYDGFMQAYDIGFQQEDLGQFDEEKEVWGVTGACILFRTEMLNEIGLYWEKIKLHLDEVELFIRAHKSGWRVVYTPKTTVWHKYMQSTDQNKLYKIDNAKKKVWLWIALRHYPFKSKLAMLRNYFF